MNTSPALNPAVPYLRGIGQIMLQPNSWTGLLFLIGIVINSFLLAAGLIVGAVVGTLTAKILKYDAKDINEGLYTFNSALVGIGMLVFFESTWLTWLGIVVLSVLSVVLMRIFIWKQVPAFTFPFVVSLWIGLWVFSYVFSAGAAEPEDLTGLVEGTFTFDLMNFGFGFGEVIFQASLVSGLFFFVGVYLSNPNGALHGLAGSIAAIILAAILIDNIDAAQQGWFAFNAVLVSIALSGARRIDGIFVLIGVTICVLIETVMMNLGWTFLTFPFIAAAWITMIIRSLLSRKSAESH